MSRSTAAERERESESVRARERYDTRMHGLRRHVAVAWTQDKDQCEKEALERMLAENAQRVEEAQRAAEARRVADEEERYARLAAPRAISNKIKTVQLSHTPQVASCVVPGRAAASLWALANQPFFRALSLGACHLHKRWSRV